jgi:hypothetical protein
MMYREFSTILKEADAAKYQHQVVRAWKELLCNSDYYTIAELEFAAEHLTGIIDERFKTDLVTIIPQDVRKGKG